jgi:hypothetical protein
VTVEVEQQVLDRRLWALDPHRYGRRLHCSRRRYRRRVRPH